MGVWTRYRQKAGPDRPDASFDPGVQYLRVRHTQRLTEAGAAASVGSTGGSYDDALAEAFNSLCMAELVRNRAPRRTSTSVWSPSPSTSTGSATDVQRL